MDKDVITPDMRAVAQDYLTRRIENEVSFGAALETALSFAVERICAVVSKYGISEEQLMNDQIPAKARREIDDIVEDLAADLAEDVLLLAKDTRDDIDWFTAFLKREFEDGWTFDTRLRGYTKSFSSQVLMAIAALQIAGIPSTLWQNLIRSNLKDLYNASFVRYARDRKLSYFSPIGFGRGAPHNMSVALDYLGRQVIANAWMQWDYEDNSERGAVGYYVERGSNYPCVECDGNAMRWHPIGEGLCVPTHSHCCCVVIYVY